MIYSNLRKQPKPMMAYAACTTDNE